MRMVRLTALLAGAAAGLPLSVAAEGTTIGIKASTLGAGVELAHALSPKTNVRFGLNGYTYDFSSTESGINYHFDLKLRSGTLLLDWHPFGGSFRTTLGGLYNRNKIEGRASGDLTIGDNVYTTTLNGAITFQRGTPYAGIGWGRPVGARKRFDFAFDLGVVYQGSPRVTLRANGVSEADLDKEARELQTSLDDYKYYPVVAFTFSFQF